MSGGGDTVERAASPTPAEQLKHDLATLTVAELRERYPGERHSHARMLDAARHDPGRNTVHSEFRPFKSFLAHMGPKGDPLRTLDRTDWRDPEYGPGKCRWATKGEQANNRSNTLTLRHADGRVLPLTEWARITDQNPDTMRKRLQRGGWTEEEVIDGRSTAARPRPARNKARIENPWPDGLPEAVQAKLAPAYAIFVKSLPEAQRHHLSRALFVAWVLGAWVAARQQRVSAAFPDFREGDQDVPTGYTTHPDVRALMMMTACHAAAHSMMPPSRWREVEHWLTHSPALNATRRALRWKLVAEHNGNQ